MKTIIVAYNHPDFIDRKSAVILVGMEKEKEPTSIEFAYK